MIQSPVAKILNSINLNSINFRNIIIVIPNYILKYMTYFVLKFDVLLYTINLNCINHFGNYSILFDHT